MHIPVLGQHDSVPNTQKLLNSPMHDTVAPERRHGTRHTTSSALESDLSESSLDELLGVGNHHARLANLAHRAGDQVSDDELSLDTVGLELGTERGGPVLQECLGARVGGQERSREETAEGAHGEDQAAATRNHAGSDDLGDLESSLDVDGDDVFHLDVFGLEKRHGHVVALADVVDKDCDVQPFDEFGQALVVGGRVLRKVHGEGLGLHASELGGYLGSEGIELGGGARNEDNVEAFLSELECKLLADTVRRSGDQRPGTFGSILSQLFIRRVSSSIVGEVNQSETYVGSAEDEQRQESIGQLEERDDESGSTEEGESVKGAITDEAVEAGVKFLNRHD